MNKLCFFFVGKTPPHGCDWVETEQCIIILKYDIRDINVELLDFRLIKSYFFIFPFSPNLPKLVSFKLQVQNITLSPACRGAQRNVKDSKGSCYINNIIVCFLLSCHYSFSYIESVLLIHYFAWIAVPEDIKSRLTNQWFHPLDPPNELVSSSQTLSLMKLLLRKDQGLSGLKTDYFMRIHT